MTNSLRPQLTPYVSRSSNIVPVNFRAEEYFHPRYLNIDLPQKTVDACVSILSEIRAELDAVEEYRKKKKGE